MALWDRIKESASSQTQLEAKKNELKSGSFRGRGRGCVPELGARTGYGGYAERQRVGVRPRGPRERPVAAAGSTTPRGPRRPFGAEASDSPTGRLPGQTRQPVSATGDRHGEDEARRGRCREPKRDQGSAARRPTERAVTGGGAYGRRGCSRWRPGAGARVRPPCDLRRGPGAGRRNLLLAAGAGPGAAGRRLLRRRRCGAEPAGLGGVTVSVSFSLLVVLAWFGSLTGTVLLHRSGSRRSARTLLSVAVSRGRCSWPGRPSVFCCSTASAGTCRRNLPHPPRLPGQRLHDPHRLRHRGLRTGRGRLARRIDRRGAGPARRTTAPALGPAAGDAPLVMGSTGLLYAYDEEGEFFWVSPYEAALDPGPNSGPHELPGGPNR
ncbi:hypothetical protein SCALM49S_06217 [Streptomyces californicus]